MPLDSLDAVRGVDGAVMVSWPNAGQASLYTYGQTYGVDRYGNPYRHFDCNQAWVSCNADPASEEWQNAVKVKKAMAIAIDRQAMVDHLLGGHGRPLYMQDWLRREDKANSRWTHQYDPERAKRLLAEAGYADGFAITLTPAIRQAPAEVQTCDAVGQFWERIGIDVEFRTVTYSTLRPDLVARKYQGATCRGILPPLTPGFIPSFYLAEANFSYGTEHPWLEENIADLLAETNSTLFTEKERKVYDWMYENVMSFGLYSYDAVWPVGQRLDPDWQPVDFSDVRSPSGFEYIKHRK